MGWLSKIFGGEAKKEGGMKMESGGMKMAKDPVCGMDVDEKTAVAKSEHMGKTYYFCAIGCKKAFDQNPAKYLEGGGQAMAGHGGHM